MHCLKTEAPFFSLTIRLYDNKLAEELYYHLVKTIVVLINKYFLPAHYKIT